MTRRRFALRRGRQSRSPSELSTAAGRALERARPLEGDEQHDMQRPLGVPPRHAIGRAVRAERRPSSSRPSSDDPCSQSDQADGAVVQVRAFFYLARLSASSWPHRASGLARSCCQSPPVPRLTCASFCVCVQDSVDSVDDPQASTAQSWQALRRPRWPAVIAARRASPFFSVSASAS